MLPDRLQTTDGLELALQHWPQAQPKAWVLVVHGLGEHGGRYQHVAAALTQAGYAVIAPDHRGHGRSGGQPRCYLTRFDQFVDDLELIWREAQTAYPNLPALMLGHSMGAHIAARFALRHQDSLRALALSGVGILPGESIPPFLISLSKVLGRLTPMLPLSGLDSTTVSRDPAVVKAYQDDPLVYHGKLRAGMGAALLTAGEDTLARLGELRLPLLVMHGEADQLVPKRASQLLYDAASSPDKTLTIYPGLYHEILNEPEQAQVIAQIIAWFDSHL